MTKIFCPRMLWSGRQLYETLRSYFIVLCICEMLPHHVLCVQHKQGQESQVKKNTCPLPRLNIHSIAKHNISVLQQSLTFPNSDSKGIKTRYRMGIRISNTSTEAEVFCGYAKIIIKLNIFQTYIDLIGLKSLKFS